VKTKGSGITDLLVVAESEASFFFGAGFSFSAGLLQAGAGDDLRDLLRTKVTVEFGEDPDAPAVSLLVATAAFAIGGGVHGETSSLFSC
jgi:hypothetical protein